MLVSLDVVPRGQCHPILLVKDEVGEVQRGDVRLVPQVEKGSKFPSLGTDVVVSWVEPVKHQCNFLVSVNLHKYFPAPMFNNSSELNVGMDAEALDNPAANLHTSAGSTLNLLWNLGSTMGSCPGDRKSTRLNSSHSQISYAVFCF